MSLGLEPRRRSRRVRWGVLRAAVPVGLLVAGCLASVLLGTVSSAASTAPDEVLAGVAGEPSDEQTGPAFEVTPGQTGPDDEPERAWVPTLVIGAITATAVGVAASWLSRGRRRHD